MRNVICLDIILYLFLFHLPVHAQTQTLSVQGRLIDSERNELPAATVRCYTNDTVLVKGTTSNSKGEFELKLPQSNQVYKLLFNYVGYKALTVMINPTEERTVRLGDVVMDRNTVQMQEVTVLGENRIQTEEKLMVYPTKEQLRHTFDGYSAVDALMIPGLRYDLLESQLKYVGGENILICINGMEATTQEVKDLNAKDIKRIDFYENGRPDYPVADVVLDFVLKERDYAASVGVDGGTQFTSPMVWGVGKAQYFQGKSEFAFSLSGSYQDLNMDNDNCTQVTYRFPQQEIMKTVEELPSEQMIHNQHVFLNYIYLGKNQTFYSSLRFNREGQENDIWRQQISNISDERYVQQEYRKQLNIYPSLQLRYNRSFRNNQKLRLELYGSYNKNHNDRWYEYRQNETATSFYNNSTAETGWYSDLKANYTKTFSNNSSFNIELNQDFTHAKNDNIRAMDAEKIYVNRSNTRFYTTYNYRVKNKLSLQAQVAGHLSYIHTDGKSNFNAYFIPSLKLTYIHKRHILNTQLTIKSIEPDLANRTGDEYLRDEYELFVGNPDLKDNLNYNWRINYSWRVTNRFTINALFNYIENDNHVYEQVTCDSERNLFIFHPINGGRLSAVIGQLGLEYELIPRRFRIGVTNNFVHMNRELWGQGVLNHYVCNGYGSFTYKNWMFRLDCKSKQKAADDTSGSIVYHPFSASFSIRYSTNNLHLTFGALNPFIKAKIDSRYKQSDYALTQVIRKPKQSDNMFYFNVNYRISFGKKKHKFDNTETKDVNPSMIK